MKTNKIIFLLFLPLFFLSCNLFDTIKEEIVSTKDYNAEITAVSLSTTSLNVTVGESEYVKLSLSPSANQGKCSVSWEYDEVFIDAAPDNFGVIITGKKAGTTWIKAKCNGIVSTCLIAVVSNGEDASENPYIYSNSSVVQLQPGNTETVVASLYGGNIADMEDFIWEIKDDSIASIAPARNNCIITARKTGSTQLVCKHPKAEYEYTFVIYCYTDSLKETYITTDFNVFSINKNEQSSRIISVDLVNPLSATYKNGFKWNYADEQSKTIISLNANLDTAEIVPLKNGVAKISVSHENAQYSLDIIVRVITIVENVYIDLSSSTLVITSSDAPYTVYASLKNFEGYVDPDSFIWTVPDSAKDLCDIIISGNSLQIMGKKNGSFKVNVANEKSQYSRNVLVILQNQIGSAIDASMYITTDQNYIQTQVGREPTVVNVRLIGGISGTDDVGDEKTNFIWYIKGGVNNGIVEIQEHTGVVMDSSSRSAATSGEFCNAQLVINPLSAGELTIAVGHPRCLYETEISVKVYSEDALVNPLVISTDTSLIRLLNGKSQAVTAELRNHKEGDENNIEWSSANSDKVSVLPPSGPEVEISARGNGSGQTYVTAHLDGALSDKKILVLTADTQEELDSMKGIFADNTYLRISAGEIKTISVEQFGLSSSDRVSWSVDDPSLCIVEGESSSDYCTSARVTGVSKDTDKKGKTTYIRAIIDGCEPVVFDVTVLPEGTSSEIFDENAGYLTTNKNAFVLESEGSSETVSVTGVNISTVDMALYTNWVMQDVNAEEGNPVFTLAGSPGPSVTLTAERPGKSVLKVTNKKSSNSLSINAKCGELYEWVDDYIIYITTENDVVNIVNGGSTTIGAALVNTTATANFYWNVIEGQENIEIIGLASGTCQIKGINPGQSIIEISNPLAGEITKEILVNVANSEEELRGFKYLTTKNNVVTVGEGMNSSVSVDIVNSDSNIVSGFTWKSQDTSVCEVVGSGSVAVIYGKGIGSAKVIVENYSYCDYPLEIIVNVVDPIQAANDPYISCNNIVTCTVDGDMATIAAELIGGKESDTTDFSWAVLDSSVAMLYASNDSAQVKALKEGVTQIIVQHPKASCSRTILVICEPKVTTKCYISVTESIIKMKPTDEAKTLSATLINGEPDDVYDFKWWADSYEKINMNYSGESCIIEPLSSGTVNIHVSHPKAAAVKDIVLYISSYSDFAFESKYVEVTTGSNYFVNMEVPATGVDCDISYWCNNYKLCNVFGNSSVCTLQPGTLDDGKDSDSCTVIAKLLTKGGAVQATAELLVSVTRKNESRPYIGLEGSASTIITMNKGETYPLKAKVYGNTFDTDSAGLNWKVNNGSGSFVEINGIDKGPSVQIKALNSGKTTITVSHNDSTINPMTIYVIVAGVSDPTVSLNYAKLPIVIGEDKATLTATVQNDTGEELEWSVKNDIDGSNIQDFFVFTPSGNKAYIYAEKPGKATVTVRIPSFGASASCEVEVTEAPSVNFFIYDDEYNFEYNTTSGTFIRDSRNKLYISSLQLYPGEVKPLHWETKPDRDKIKEWYRSDNSFFSIDSVNAGYISFWKNAETDLYAYYPKNVGTILVTGTSKEGTAVLQIKTESEQMDSVSVTNSYNYLLSLDKSIVSATPKEVHDDEKILYVNYELRPACSKIIITPNSQQVFCKNLKLLNATEVDDGNGSSHWEVSSHESTADSIVKGTVIGTLKFQIIGEVNTDIKIYGVNENIITSGNTPQKPDEFGEQIIKMQVFYPKHTFKPVIEKQVPFVNQNVYSSTEKNAKYSYYDETTNSIFLGDGEYLSGNVNVNTETEPYSNVSISSVNFVKSTSSIKDKVSSTNSSIGNVQSDYVAGTSNGTSKENTYPFQLYHVQDYAVYKYKESSSGTWKTTRSFIIPGTKQFTTKNTDNGMENMYRLNIESDKFSEVRNDTVKETSYVGYLEVKYANYVQGSGDASYKIPVYVQVRNCPASDDNNYLLKITQ